MMGAEVIMQHLCGSVPREFCSGIQQGSSNPLLHIGSHVKCKRKHPQTVQYRYHLKGPRACTRTCALWKAGNHSCGNGYASRLDFSVCRCQHAESVSEEASDGKNGAWFKELGNKASPYVNEVGVQNILGSEELQHIESNARDSMNNGNKLTTALTSKHLSYKQRGSVVEDEAWNLLQESVVYYCGSPIGTIAANDPSDANVLNYDQVFIRDFIPSGIAFHTI